MNLARTNKYHARGVRGDGRFFGSGLEHKRWRQLVLMERAGVIRDLRHQVTVELAGAVKYRADFAYIETVPNRLVYEDSKGMVDRRFQVITQLWPLWGDAPLRITGTGGRLLRELLPQPQRRVAWMREEITRLETGISTHRDLGGGVPTVGV